MSITVSWEGEGKHIIRFIYEEPWTWQELFASIKDVTPIHNALPHKVVWIMDLENSKKIPGGALTQARQIAQMRHDNTYDTTIVIHDGPFLGRLAEIFNTVFGQRLNTEINMVQSLESALAEAHKLIEKDKEG